MAVSFRLLTRLRIRVGKEPDPPLCVKQSSGPKMPAWAVLSSRPSVVTQATIIVNSHVMRECETSQTVSSGSLYLIGKVRLKSTHVIRPC